MGLVFTADGKKLVMFVVRPTGLKPKSGPSAQVPGDQRRGLAFEGTAEIRNVATGRGDPSWTHPVIFGLTDKVALSPDGRCLAWRGLDMIRAWDLRTGEELWQLPVGVHGATDFSFGPSAGLVLVAMSAAWDPQSVEPGTIRTLETDTGHVVQTFRGHDRPVVSMALTPDGRRLASASEDGTVRLWDTATGQEVLTLKGRFHKLVFGRDGQCLHAVNEEMVRTWAAPRSTP
jgi:WD40 repeat protein